MTVTTDTNSASLCSPGHTTGKQAAASAAGAASSEHGAASIVCNGSEGSAGGAASTSKKNTTPGGTATTSTTLTANGTTRVVLSDQLPETPSIEEEAATTTTTTTSDSSDSDTNKSEEASTEDAKAEAEATSATGAEEEGTAEGTTTTTAEAAAAEEEVDQSHKVISVNLSSLLPKKSKHGRIGGSLYRALREAGVDVSALNIPRGRPPRNKVGEKREKRPTLVSFIKSGGELPMLPGKPRLRIVNDEDAAEMGEEVQQLRDLGNNKRKRGAGRKTYVSKKAKQAAEAAAVRQMEEAPIAGLVEDDAAATGLLLMLGDMK